MALPKFTELFGDQLQSKTGPISTVDALAGKKAVLVYFSAHWCPPCRGFTPKLAEFHKKHAKSQDFEVVFVSSDRDQKAFDEYFGEMPWLALPFENRAQKDVLSKKYKVQGIPTLVVLGAEGELITTDGRGKVMQNFEDCAGFPWGTTTAASNPAPAPTGPPRAQPQPCNSKKASDKLIEIFGGQLQGKAGTTVSTTEALAGKKAVFVYFSAHWCPPCRGFTPKLAEFHKKHAKSQDFEVVFVSSDRDQKAFDEYFGEMPWLALPFANRAQKEALSKKYKVQGIPTLVVLGAEGELITTDGRGKVMQNFEDCAGFPWAPKPFRELLGDSFLKRNFSGKSKKWGCLPMLRRPRGSRNRGTAGREAIEGKTLGLYFSAHWCPPCRGFTPVLKKFYEDYKAQDPNFEIIFVSSDENEKGMLEYFDNDHGDYLALPFSARQAKAELSSMFKVDGIPSFVVVGADGQLINANARGKVSAGVEAVLAQGWAPPAVGDMAQGPEAAGTDINECPAVLVMCEGADKATQTAIEEAMEPLAKKYIEKAKQTGEDPEYIFLISKGARAGPVEHLKALTKKEAGDTISSAQVKKQPVMMLLDIPDNGGFYLSGADDVVITTETIAAFIAHKEAGRAKRMQLQRS